MYLQIFKEFISEVVIDHIEILEASLFLIIGRLCVALFPPASYKMRRMSYLPFVSSLLAAQLPERAYRAHWLYEFDQLY
jgi:hypothetical protein